MGGYGVSNQELYNAIVKALDEIEGDFTRAQLISICEEVGRDYKYVSDEEG